MGSRCTRTCWISAGVPAGLSERGGIGNGAQSRAQCAKVSGATDSPIRGSYRMPSARAHHRARPVPDIEFAVDIVEVPFQGALRYEYRLGDFPVAQAGLQALENRHLALGQLLAS